MENSTFTAIYSSRIVPVVVLEDAAVAVDLADALLDAGLQVIEITFRTAAACAAIAALASQRPKMRVGAGTLLLPENVRQAREAGASFGVAPGLNPRTVEAALNLGMEFAPGVATPSEVERALEFGCKLQKFFPAEQAGGAEMLKALAGPYGHTGVRFIPTGGINQSNMKNYLALKNVAAVGGSWFVDKKFIAARDWTVINQLARAAVTIVRS